MTSIRDGGFEPVMDPMARPPRKRPFHTGDEEAWDMPPTSLSPRRSRFAQDAFGTDITKLDPTDDLRSKQIAPGSNPRLARTQRQTDTARDRYADTPMSEYLPVQAPTADPQSQRLRGAAEGALGTGIVQNTDPSRSQGFLNRAATSYGASPTSVGGGVTYGGDTGSVRSLLARGIEGLQGPDRGKIATDVFDLMRQKAAPGRDAERRALGARQVALGRMGAGMTTTALNDLESEFRRSDDETMRDLALRAAGDTLEDKLNVARATESGFGTLAGEDRAAAGMGMEAASRNADLLARQAEGVRGLSRDQLGLDRLARDEGIEDREYGLDRSRAWSDMANDVFREGQSLRNEARGERSDRFNYDDRRFDRNRSVFRDLGDEEDRIYDQGRRYRDEMRGERDFQVDASERGINNAVKQRMLEEDLLDRGFNRETDRTDLFDRLGNRGFDQYLDTLGGNAAREEAIGNDAMEGVGDAFSEFMLEEARRRSGPTTNPLPELDIPRFGERSTNWQDVARAGRPDPRLRYGFRG